MLNRPSPRRTIWSSGVAILALATLLSGCAARRAITPGSSEIPVGGELSSGGSISSAQRDRVLREAMSAVLLAREQMRLGMVDEAEAEWNRAIELLAPLATQDSSITSRLRAISAERDRAVAEFEQQASVEEPEDENGEDADADAATTGDDNSPRVIILEAPEPEVDPEHLAEVEEAVQDIRQDATPDYPVESNQRVIAWLEAWSGRLKDFFSGSIERSGLYVDRLREIFAQEGLPQDLVYLAHVESGFKTSAHSRAKAKGVFQFIPETGRRYGLTYNRFVDERSDPEKSARASASYLRDLYEEFQDWKLALAAYNAGEGKIRRVIAQTGIRDFWDPRFQRHLRQETRNYVPAIFAATLIAKEPAKFGFGAVTPLSAQTFELVDVPQATPLTAIARLVGIDAAQLTALNPELRRGHTPPSASYKLKVPIGSSAQFAEKYASLTAQELRIQYDVMHRVRRGETLSKIASRYRTSVAELKRINHLRSTTLRVGQSLRVPADAATAQAASDETTSSSRRRSSQKVASASPKPTWYRVRRGDTLTEIAARFDVEVAELQAWNDLRGSTRVAIGQKLRIAAPAAAGPTAPAVGEKRETERVAADKARTHTVRSGETLWRIAQSYGVTLDALLDENGLGKQSVIKPGMRLRIPKSASAGSQSSQSLRPVVHVVRRGDTLSSIASRYKTSIEALCRDNRLVPTAEIHPGDTLSISR